MRWLVVLTLSVATWHRAMLYQSDFALWQDTVIYAPTFRALVNYRSALLASGNLEGAILLCPQLQQAAQTAHDRALLSRLCLDAPF